MAGFRPILPKPFNAKAIEDEFIAAAIATTDDWEKQFRVTHQTFSTVRPAWKKDVRLGFKEMVFVTQTENDIYRFLNDGTDIRYAVMTRDFEAKTAPGRFRPTGGHPGFSHMDFNYARARLRAIKPREWDIQIKNRTERHVFRRFQRALETGVQKSGHQFI